uniref:Uncharacterized protein n=1 Tax=Ciona savignyi TaxID=51511 RepID=H2Z0Y8_CIOSA
MPDQTPLRNAVTKYISTEESLDTFNPKLHEFSNESQLLFYLKNEVTPANITEYFKLNGGTGAAGKPTRQNRHRIPAGYYCSAEGRSHVRIQSLHAMQRCPNAL